MAAFAAVATAVLLVVLLGPVGRVGGSANATTGAVDLNDALAQLSQFHADYVQEQQTILEREKVYIAVAEETEEPKEPPLPPAQQREQVEQTHEEIEALRERVGRRIKALDAVVLSVDELCSGTVEEPRVEHQCEALHDQIQKYEAEVSTFTGMMEVMDRRYEEAKAALK